MPTLSLELSVKSRAMLLKAMSMYLLQLTSKTSGDMDQVLDKVKKPRNALGIGEVVSAIT